MTILEYFQFHLIYIQPYVASELRVIMYIPTLIIINNCTDVSNDNNITIITNGFV